MTVLLNTLEEHVRQSNLIENIRDAEGTALFDSHLLAAKNVVETPFATTPCDIHKMLAHGTEMEAFGGILRECEVFVGSREFPDWKLLPELMILLEEYVKRIESEDVKVFL